MLDLSHLISVLVLNPKVATVALPFMVKDYKHILGVRVVVGILMG